MTRLLPHLVVSITWPQLFHMWCRKDYVYLTSHSVLLTNLASNMLGLTLLKNGHFQADFHLDTVPSPLSPITEKILMSMNVFDLTFYPLWHQRPRKHTD